MVLYTYTFDGQFELSCGITFKRISYIGGSMLKKVCMLVDWNMYEVVRHFTKKLAEAMERKGIEVQIIDAHEEDIDPDLFRDFMINPPDITCSFNRIAKLSSGKYLWDFLKIPHVAFLVDPPIYYLDLTDSPYIVLTSVDRSDAAAVRSIFPKMLFWPHAVERELLSDEKSKRDKDVVFFGSCFDFLGLRREWKTKLTPQLDWILDFAIDIALINSSITLSEALSSAWEAGGLKKSYGQENFLLLYHYFEKFMLGKDRYELLYAIQDANVHVYGESFPLSKDKKYPEWSELLPNKKNIVFHPPVPYTESFEILKTSKICLNSVPSFRDGTHERIFSGLACGALPVTSDSKYLGEFFTHKENILFYKANHWLEVNGWINDFLEDEKKRKIAAAKGREIVMKHHTWDVRVEQLLRELPAFLPKK